MKEVARIHYHTYIHFPVCILLVPIYLYLFGYEYTTSNTFWSNYLYFFATTGVNGLVSYDKFRDALYMIDIGQNDIADSFARGLSYAQVVKKIPSILAEIKNAIKVNSQD